jgi:16S rRNA (guanine527-N7)-methyltransferase
MGYATESNTSTENASGKPLRAEDFQAMAGVSDAVIEHLSSYLNTLQRWQKKINLVGAATLSDPWRRHILDSGQLYPLLSESDMTIVDIGSGAGFPALVLAILDLQNVNSGTHARQFHLIESDSRKCIFLNEIIRLSGVAGIVHNVRVEAYMGPRADAVTARACAPLAQLVSWTAPLLAARGRGLFLKGKKVQDELTLTAKDWRMDVIKHTSVSDTRGVILEVKNLAQYNDQ